MSRQWLDPTPIIIPPQIAALNLHPLVAETLIRRGITRADSARAFLDPAQYTPSDPFTLPDMDRAVERLARAIRGGESILVWGDFDVDGQTSTALLVSALRAFGAQVLYHIPDRDKEGHGINVAVLAGYLAAAESADRVSPLAEFGQGSGVGLLLTCDTGVTAHDAIALANAHRVDVIVTDHHSLPSQLPPAYAVVNPRRLPDPDRHPLGTLPGVGVAYQLIAALSHHLRAENMPPVDLQPYVDLVALGVVADVALQQGDARYLLQRGIAAIRADARPGIAALIELARLDESEQFSEEQIGFQIAPRLNALGRLSDAAQGVELLLNDDIDDARQRAVNVEQLNAYRRMMSDQIFAAAMSQIERDRDLLDAPVLVLGSAAWIPGIVGIVANRVVEQVNRPVILFGASASRDDDTAPAPKSGSGQGGAVALLKGSARSTAGIDITAALTKADADQPGLIHAFGGHTMAAGMSIDADRLTEFRYAINHAMRALGITAAPPATVQIAAYVDFAAITRDTVEAVAALAPFGPGNPPLILATKNVRIESKRGMGRGGAHVRFTLSDVRGDKRTAIWWRGGALADAISEGGIYDLAFVARLDNYRDKRDVYLEWIDTRLVESAPIITQREIELIDQRGVADAAAVLRDLQARYPDLAVYAEVDKPEHVRIIGRDHAEPVTTLILWTAPSSRAMLRALIEHTNAGHVVAFFHDAAMDAFDPFVKRLAGLAKYAIAQRGGVAAVDQLSAATGQPHTTVMLGMRWLAHQGIVDAQLDGDHYVLQVGSALAYSRAETNTVVFVLRARLAETAAYRGYLRTATADALRRQLTG